jgi:hypothetical protein
MPSLVPLRLPFASLACLALAAGRRPRRDPRPVAADGATPAGPAPSAGAPSPDPRVGLRAGLMDAGEAAWNLRVLSRTPPPDKFRGSTNSDLAFTGPYAIQGSYNGFQVWDLTDPAKPALATSYYCPRRRATCRSTATCCSCRARGGAGGSTAATRACATR